MKKLNKSVFEFFWLLIVTTTTKTLKMKRKISNYNLKLANQILLFINIWSSLAWSLSSFYLLYYQADYQNSVNFSLVGFCIIVGSVIEIMRLYLGYSGNIKSNVSF